MITYSEATVAWVYKNEDENVVSAQAKYLSKKDDDGNSYELNWEDDKGMKHSKRFDPEAEKKVRSDIATMLSDFNTYAAPKPTPAPATNLPAVPTSDYTPEQKPAVSTQVQKGK